jgi:hypothetical protein
MLIDTTEFDGPNPEDAVVGGGGRPLPGIYQVAVNHAREEGSKSKGTPGISVEFQVLCEGLTGYKKVTDNKGRLTEIKGGTPTSEQTGKTIPKFFAFVGKDEASSEFCMKCVTRFALASGVVKPGQQIEPDWDAAMGLELIIELEPSTYEDKKGMKRTGSDLGALGMWGLANPAVANVPRDLQSPGMLALAKAGGPVQRPQASGNGNGNGANAVPTPPADKPAAADTAGTAGKSIGGKWSNL